MFLFSLQTSNFYISEIAGRRKLPDLSMNNIFHWFYRLVYNILSHLNDLILASSALLQ